MCGLALEVVECFLDSWVRKGWEAEGEVFRWGTPILGRGLRAGIAVPSAPAKPLLPPIASDPDPPSLLQHSRYRVKLELFCDRHQKKGKWIARVPKVVGKRIGGTWISGEVEELLHWKDSSAVVAGVEYVLHLAVCESVPVHRVVVHGGVLKIQPLHPHEN